MRLQCFPSRQIPELFSRNSSNKIYGKDRYRDLMRSPLYRTMRALLLSFAHLIPNARTIDYESYRSRSLTPTLALRALMAHSIQRGPNGGVFSLLHTLHLSLWVNFLENSVAPGCIKVCASYIYLYSKKTGFADLCAKNDPIIMRSFANQDQQNKRK